jgi:carbamate kinase
MEKEDSSILVALGGNAISREGEEGNIVQQFQHTEETMREIVRTVYGRYDRIIVTHGNGPQIGNIVQRSELAAATVFPLPLDTCVSDSEGGMGYMIQQVLGNVLRESGVPPHVVCIVTQVVVGIDDPLWQNPTKFIGRFYSKDEADILMAERGWRMREDANRGWRRVVPSPTPQEVVEAEAVSALLDRGIIVIAVGGGGIPVVRDGNGRLHGAEAVIDKDLASSLLCRTLGIGTFVILTGVEKVALDYGKPTQRHLDEMTVEEAEVHLRGGQFPPGSMGPKIQAAIDYLRGGGKRVIITSPGKLGDALEGKTGTVVH